jgi:dTMP kinase
MFITFEGGEGSGKSVQSRRLYRRLVREGFSALLVREPGGTPLGEAIARWLKWHKGAEISAETELLLFNASRSHLVNKVIRPALSQGKVIVCDRFTDSTLAYQGFGRGLEMARVLEVNSLGTGGLKPDLTFLMDIDPDDGLQRKRADKADRFETEQRSFHQKIRRGYLALAHAEPGRWYIVDASRPRHELAALVWDKVSRALACRES